MPLYKGKKIPSIPEVSISSRKNTTLIAIYRPSEGKLFSVPLTPAGENNSHWKSIGGGPWSLEGATYGCPSYTEEGYVSGVSVLAGGISTKGIPLSASTDQFWEDFNSGGSYY